MQSSKQTNRRGEACLTLCLALLSACAPASSSASFTSLTDTATAQPAPGIAALAVNPSGALVCIAGGRAYKLENLKTWSALPSPTSASSAAWRDGNWWLALPGAGLIYKATGVPQSVSATGSPALLTGRFAFTTSGEVLDYSGASIGRVGGLPSATLETTGATFALVGRVVYAIDRAVERRQTLEAGVNSLVSLNDEVQVLPGIATRAGGFTYTLRGRELTASDSADRVITRIQIAGVTALLIAAPDWIAIASGSSLRVLSAGDLSPVFASSCGGGL